MIFVVIFFIFVFGSLLLDDGDGFCKWNGCELFLSVLLELRTESHVSFVSLL